MPRWQRERQELWDTMQRMAALGLVAGANGNASVRLRGEDGRDLVCIKPTGRPYDQLHPDDLVVLDLEGEPVEGDLAPSSETPLHLGVYRARPDARAIVHTHSVAASALAVAGQDLPPLIDEMVVVVGGAVRVARYAFPGTEDLAACAVEALGGRTAALLRHHGLVAVGRTPREALDVAHLVERVAQVYIYARLLGTVQPLPQEVVEVEEQLFRMHRAAREEEERS